MWEGQVLGALNQAKRYPKLAMTRRQQGVPYIRFVMNRDGAVLSSQLERSSGFPDLDRDANRRLGSPIEPRSSCNGAIHGS
ncbi:TonB family protein [Sphingobium sp. CR28]|uniref:TonB family protein n=1 Tax=Sphingobium sp. CR28 TaxID=3400272 RepID=UPI003FEF5091